MNRQNAKKQQPSSRRARCGKCGPCLSPDCGTCEHCRRKKKFGGDGSSRQACIMRGCVLIHGDPDAPGGQKYVKPRFLKPPPSASAATDHNDPHVNPGRKPPPPNAPGAARASRNPRGAGGVAMMRAREPDSSSDTNMGKGGAGGVAGGNRKKTPKRPFTFATEMEATLFPDPPAPKEKTLQEDENDIAPEGDDGGTEGDDGRPATKKIKRPVTVFRSRFMGRKIPNPPLGVCAKCGQDDSLETVLLCDGNDCGREYHLSCAELEDIPAGDWYCIDCHPTGTGYDELVEYFEHTDEIRGGYGSPSAFCVAMLKDELGDVFPNVPESELVAADPKKWIGKPVWIQVAKTAVVGGRIVNHRTREYSGDKFEEHEYLVRFAAGHCRRKETYHHWIYLEEHQLMVGDDFVWAGNDPNELLPAMVYRRNSRFLVQSSLGAKSKKEGSHSPTSKTSVASENDSKAPSSTVAVGYFGRVGSDKFDEVERGTLVGLDNTSAQETFGNRFSAQLAAAAAEKDEQEDVVRWSKLPAGNPFHPLALKSRDYFTLPLLSAREPSADQEGELHTGLCPLIMQGLDHQYLMEMLEKNHKIQPTREIAASLSCQTVPYKWQETKSRNERMETE